MDDTDALAGQTFYRAVASPAVAGRMGYIEVLNPAGSGVDLFVDDFYVWPGSATVSGEVGIIHYATPFNETGGAFDSPGLPAYSAPIVCTRYGYPNAKSVLWVGTYPGQLEPQIDYIFQGATQSEPGKLEHPPYGIILAPSDGIVFWNPTPNEELKLGVWVREKPAV